MVKHFVTAVTSFLASTACLPAQTIAAPDIRSQQSLQSFFHYRDRGHTPVISGHRGGVASGFPENSIEAFANTLKHTNAFFEIDPRLTKDSVVVLMHDATLDRTTTGRGNLSDYTYKELQKLYLKDKNGNLTPYKIPTLLEALEWSKGKTVLNLDNKGVPFPVIAALIRKSRNPVTMLTIHTPEQASYYLSQDANCMFSVHILTDAAFKQYESSGIPWKNMIVYIGSEITDTNMLLLNNLHKKGVMCMISAAPVFDKLPTVAERAGKYRFVFSSGADILETDRPIEAAEAVK